MEGSAAVLRNCMSEQLSELETLSLIYCQPGELDLRDAGVIADFTEFIKLHGEELPHTATHMSYTITLNVNGHKIAVRIELPNFYPQFEHAKLTVYTPILSANKVEALHGEIKHYIETVDKTQAYVFQVLNWLEDKIHALITSEAAANVKPAVDPGMLLVDFERIWIYTHHIKSASKRQEIVKEARRLNLSGFSRPGNPGVICVEGERENVQLFWRYIKTLSWHSITICKSECATKPRNKIEQLQRFQGFKEQIFSVDPEKEGAIMDMSGFVKFLEQHKSGYMKNILFGLE